MKEFLLKYKIEGSKEFYFILFLTFISIEFIYFTSQTSFQTYYVLIGF